MKKKLAFLLAMVLSLSTLFCLAPMASAETTAESTVAPSQEIAYFNVSIKTNVELLFAVPAEGYTVKDGVAPVQLLLWEGASGTGRYNYTDPKAIKLDAKGQAPINGANHFIFTYNGLSAIEMSKVVYARVIYTDSIGLRSYGNLYDYSIAEYANAYLNNDNSKQKDLVEAMMDYGHFAADYKGKTSYTAEETKNLKKVTVTAKVNGTELLTQVTQLAPAGTELTLTAPHIDGYTFSSWGEGVTDGKITLNNDVELIANYDVFEFLNWDFEDESVGALKDRDSSSDFSLNGEKYTLQSGTNKNWAMGSTADDQRVPHEYSQYKFVADPNNSENKCVMLTNTGAGEVKLVDAISSFKGTGVGDTISSVTIEFDVTASANGTFAQSDIRIDRFGTATTDNGGSSISLVRFNHNGDIVLNSDSGKLIAKASATEAVRIAVTLDFANNTLIGYANGVEVCSKSGVMSATNAKDYLASLEAGKNTRFRLSYYGGYLGANFATVPASLVEDGTFTFTKVDSLVVANSFSQCYTKNSDGTYKYYNGTDPTKVPAGTELYTAVVDYDKFGAYLEANHSVYLDNILITYGDYIK